MKQKHLPKQRIFVLVGLCLTAFLSPVLQAQQPVDRDLFPIYKDGKLGFIDRTGKIIIQPQDNAGDGFSDGPARVLVGGKTSSLTPPARSFSNRYLIPFIISPRVWPPLTPAKCLTRIPA